MVKQFMKWKMNLLIILLLCAVMVIGNTGLPALADGDLPDSNEMTEEDFFIRLTGLDPYTQELALYDLIKEQTEKGRDLTIDELQVIRKKYEKDTIPTPTPQPTPSVKPEYKLSNVSYNGKAVTGKLLHADGTGFAQKPRVKVTFYIVGNYYMATNGIIEEDGSFEVGGVGPIQYITIVAFDSKPDGGMDRFDATELFVTEQ